MDTNVHVADYLDACQRVTTAATEAWTAAARAMSEALIPGLADVRELRERHPELWDPALLPAVAATQPRRGWDRLRR